MLRRPGLLLVMIAALLAWLPPAAGAARDMPLTLDPVGFAPTSEGLRQIVVYGEHAYVRSAAPPRLDIYSIADPAAPRLIGSQPQFSAIQDMLVVGNHLYLALSRKTVRVLSLADPANPQPIGPYVPDGAGNALAYAHGHLYVAVEVAGVAVYSLENPAWPGRTGTVDWWDGPANAWLAADLAVSGQRLYVTIASYPFGDSRRLIIADISDPEAPSPVAQREVTMNASVLLRVDERYGYVSKSDGEFHILDLSDSTVLTRTGAVQTETGLAAADVAGPYLYGAGPGGVRAIDIADPSAPAVAGSALSERAATDVVARGRYLYVTSDAGLHILTNGLDLSQRHYLPAVSAPGAGQGE